MLGTEFAIGTYVAIVAFLVAAGSSSRGAKTRSRRWLIVPVTYLLSSLALLLLARSPFLRYDLIMNPDEAQMAANAMLSHYGWLNWNIVDPTTSGALNSAILAWPYLFGGDITFFSTRLTGLACVFATLVFLFLALRRLSDDSTAVIATAPSVIFFAATTNFDFISYSSEQLPILLLAVAVCFFVWSFNADRLRYWVGAALVLGLVPFAKLQVAPIAATVGAFVLARAIGTSLRSGGARLAAQRGAVVTGAAALPALILLVPLALSGGFDDFLKSYLVRNLSVGFADWHNPLPGINTPMFSALLGAYAAIFGLAVLSITLSARRVRARPTITPIVAWTLTLGLVLVPVTFVSIVVRGRAFPHYLMLAVPALVTLGGVGIDLAVIFVDACSGLSAGVRWVSLVVALAIVLPVAHDKQQRPRPHPAFLQGQPFTAARTLSWLRPTGSDRMVCWGWRPQCYVDAAIAPATRETTNESQQLWAGNSYFRSRFLADFARSQPDFVIDVVAPGGFLLTNPKTNGIATFPEFAKIIADDFDLVSHVDPPDRCPRLYIRRTRLAELDRSRIAFASLTATGSMDGHPATALDDGSILDTCDDNWLLPEKTLGAAIIDFRETAPLRAVAILNTRNGNYGDRASDRIRLSVRREGKAIAAMELTLEPFPRWTYYRFDQPVAADGLIIEVLSYRGVGGGLNEVKAYRD
jgi:hypothetical protein